MDLVLTEKDFSRNESLQNDGVIASVDMERARSKLLTEKRNLEAFKTTDLNNQVRIQQIRAQIHDLQSERKITLMAKKSIVNQYINELKSQMREWEDRHFIKSPIAGQVSFILDIAENQYITSGEPIFHLIPNYNQDSPFVVEGLLPIKASGNLRIGQTAIIQLDNYPSNQYVLTGIVAEVSIIPTNNKYRVKVDLPKELLTNYNIMIPASQLLKANVAIQTQDYSLLERLFQNFLDVAKNRNQ